MTTSTRTRRARHRRTHGTTQNPYPHDYLHHQRPYTQVQHDIGGGLLLGAVTVVALLAILVMGLLR